MTGQAITFRQMLAPVSAEDFFDRYYDRAPLHIPGPSEKFQRVFSWGELNSLFNMPNIWSDRTVKVVLDGRTLAGSEFCKPVYGREGHNIMHPDPARVRHFLREGATLVLDFAESLSAPVASVSAALQVWFGGPVSCNVYCSWQAHPGFAAHFDATDVVVLQIVGTKNWRIYEGRFEHPVEMPGYETTGFPEEYHERQKGAQLTSVDLTPGDLLYLPRGQYHDALATSEASLHLTFGVTRATGLDIFMQLTDTFVDDPLFRKPLPFFGDADAHAAHIDMLADRIRTVLADKDASETIRDFQESRAFTFCYPQYELPDRRDSTIYRVHSLGARLVRRGTGYQLQTPSGKRPLDDIDAKLAEWAMSRDYFSDRELAAAAQEWGVNDVDSPVETLTEAGFLHRMPL